MVVLLPDPASRPRLRARLREEHGVQTTVFPAVHRFSAYRSQPGAVGCTGGTISSLTVNG